MINSMKSISTLISKIFCFSPTVTSSMLVCCFAASPDRGLPQIIIIYVAFLILEVALGMYFPAMSYLKSQIIPEGHRANVMNWFR